MKATTAIAWAAVLVCASAAWGGSDTPIDLISTKADVYVAPNGKDAWSGKLSAANAEGSDGPFATVQRAQQAVRELKQREPQRAGAIVVMLRGGEYTLDKALEFTHEDSGAADAPVVYAAYPGEEPLISGGVRLTGWQTTPEGYWQLTIPQVQRGEWWFIQLFVNGQRRYRTRLPSAGFYMMGGDGQLPVTPYAKSGDQFPFKHGQIHGDWHNLTDVEMLGFQSWTMARMRIAAVDDKKNVVTLTYSGELQPNVPINPFLIENVREALHQPGQWYLDRKTGVLTYIPMPGEDALKAEVVAPRLDSLLHLKGDVEKRQWVEHLQFRGLTFAYSNWTTPPQGHLFPQADVDISSAIIADGARRCLFDGCTITHVGTFGIEFNQGCKCNEVANCSLTDLGAGGVKTGERGCRYDDEDLISGQIIRNNLITGGGRLHPGAVAIWVGNSPGNLIEHNDIYDFYYTGISLGWNWGYGFSQAHDNTVAYNRIWQIGQHVLSDMGGIYLLSDAPGTVIDHNILHDIEAFSDSPMSGAVGIYFDEGTGEVLAKNNLVYRVTGGSFNSNGGRQNRAENNIFAFARLHGQVTRNGAEGHVFSFAFVHNIVLWKKCVLLGGLGPESWADNNYAFDYNLYWRTDKDPVEFWGMTLAQWQQKKGQDLHSLVADPLFVDPGKDNYTLQPGSPAAKIGFKPIDLSTTGLHPTPAQAKQAALSIPRAFPEPAR